MPNHGLLKINKNKTIIRGYSCKFRIKILSMSLILTHLLTFNLFAVKNNKHAIVLQKRIQKQELRKKFPDLFEQGWGIACVRLKYRRFYKKWIPALFQTDPKANTIIFSIGMKDAETYGDEPRQIKFKNPTGLAAYKDGSVYIADTGNNRIVKLHFNEKKLQFIRERKGFNKPMGIAVDKNGYIYVAEAGKHRILKFTSKLSPAKHFYGRNYSFGSFGYGRGKLNYPINLCVDKKGSIYVIEKNNKRISKFNRFGRFISMKRTGYYGFGSYRSKLLGITTDNYGYIYVTDSYHNYIWKLKNNLAYISVYRPTKKHPFKNLKGLAHYPNYGRLFVVEKDGGYMFMTYPFKRFPKK